MCTKISYKRRQINTPIPFPTTNKDLISSLTLQFTLPKFLLSAPSISRYKKEPSRLPFFYSSLSSALHKTTSHQPNCEIMR